MTRGRELDTRAGKRQSWELAVLPFTDAQDRNPEQRQCNKERWETKTHWKPTISNDKALLSILRACFIHFLKSYTN